MMPVAKTVVMIAAVMVIGLLAGLYVGTGLAQHSNLGVAFQPWVIRQQAEVGLFKDFMPQFGWTAVILPAVAAALTVGVPRWLFAAAALSILGTIVSTGFGELPLNRMILSWNPQVPVQGWESMRISWMHAHWTKTTFSVLAFLAAATGLSRR
ncbi:MAG TPA: anthrone oxygenase family protein [Sphingomonas sp.]|jgi:hypothetical protein|uniref:anthrone oxygenase family protein n=1 Tax=Sphingomonas sp. TaxID=28214 RepID=UPI002ED8C6DC